MNAFTPMTTTEANAHAADRQAAREVGHTEVCDQRRAQDEDRVFEARLWWFLAMSAAA
jgi:hypothetical protein